MSLERVRTEIVTLKKRFVGEARNEASPPHVRTNALAIVGVLSMLADTLDSVEAEESTKGKGDIHGRY